MNIFPEAWLRQLDKLRDSMYKNKAKCSGCNSILSNMYHYILHSERGKRELILCDDCIGSCLSRLLNDDYAGINNFETLWKYVNERKEQRKI